MNDDTPLREIFDLCAWKAKHLGVLPEDEDSIRYMWLNDEADEARPFFSSGILTEVSAAVRRELYLGRSGRRWVLCVTEVTREDFNPKEVAKELVRLMSTDKAMDGFKAIWNKPPEAS
ncbi:MAG: hypothetical protein EOM25_13070 [Deltaproteobacteria bacterium]|nr:hypothetical protein [Deltaproteobacteria bacterium]